MEMLSNPWVWMALFIAGLVVGSVWGLKKSKQKGGEESMRVNSAVVAAVVAVLVALLSLPTLSIDIEGIFTYAFDIVNAFMPLIAIVAGLGLGFNLVQKIGSLFQRAL